MAIPDYQTLLRPVLEAASSGNPVNYDDVEQHVINVFNLTEEEVEELLPSRTQRRIRNRIGWAKNNLLKAGLVDQVSRGVFRINEEGKRVLTEKKDSINDEFLMRYASFREFKDASKPDSNKNDQPGDVYQTLETPDDSISAAVSELRKTLKVELLEIVKAKTPVFFEGLVLDLLRKMGYGGKLKDSSKVVGKSHDEGIDGIIKEDALGLDVIYIQAKRYGDNSIGSEQIRTFVGSLAGHGAKKGVFITSSRFTSEALKFAEKLTSNDTNVVLIDGDQLTDFMIDYNVGVQLKDSIELKQIDQDYFDER